MNEFEPAPPLILVAEDDADIAELVGLRLRAAGFRISLVADGVQALAAASAEPPDLIVLDLSMPELNGLEVMQKLRSIDSVSGSVTPIVVLSARVDEAQISEAIVAGANAFVTKPFRSAELIEVVETLLAVRNEKN